MTFIKTLTGEGRVGGILVRLNMFIKTVFGFNKKFKLFFHDNFEMLLLNDFRKNEYFI